MSVEKQSDLPRGIFEKDGFYYIRYTDVRGKYKTEKAGTYRMAEDKLLARKIEKLRSRMPGGKARYGIKLSELIDDAINYAFSNHDEKSAHDLRLKLERIRTDLGNYDAGQITRQHVTDWLAKVSLAREWKPASYNRYQSAFSMMFRVANENGKMDWNPAKGIKQKQEDNARVRYLSRDEEQALDKTVVEFGDDFLAAFNLSVHTGMRLSEQCRCKVGDYDKDNNVLTIRQKKNRRGPSIRYVPMTPLAVLSYEKLSSGKGTGEYLFENLDTKVATYFPRCVEKAGAKDFTWHCNRHTFCSRLVMAGVPLAAVANYAGHANIQMTMRYSHLTPRANDQAIAGMMSYYKDAAGTALPMAAPCSI